MTFPVPDDADRCKGVAGKTWAKRGIVSIENLPDLAEKLTDKKIADYAKAGYVDRKWVRNHQCFARSMYGLPVEVRGRLWGVIVIDTRLPAIAHKDDVPFIFSLIVKYLGKLLEKA